MRFLVESLDRGPIADRPRFLTFMRYASVENVIRYGLAREEIPAGQYDITPWPEAAAKPITAYRRRAYKRATVTLTPRGRTT